MSHSLTIAGLVDRVALLDYEPGVMSQQKQAHEILTTIKAIPEDELAAEDAERLNTIKKKCQEVLFG